MGLGDDPGKAHLNTWHLRKSPVTVNAVTESAEECSGDLNGVSKMNHHR